MKKLLILLLGIFQTYLIVAQNDEKTTEKDTVVTTSDEPKIIYYQTDEPEDKKRNRRQGIKTLSGTMSHSGGFGALSFRTSKFRGESLVMAGVRGGWIINRTLGIGFEGHGVIPTTNFEDIASVPNGDVALNGGYGGMFLELIFFSNEVVHVTFPVSAGAGWLGYLRTGDDNFSFGVNSEVSSDVFWYTEPGANLEFNVSRNFRLDFGFSKRFTQDLELFEPLNDRYTDPDEFENLNFYITLKIGGF